MSRIEWRRLRNLTARQITNALTHDGFVLFNQRGSHQRYRHTDGRRVTVTFHRASDTFPIGTLRSMIELQARGQKTTCGASRCWSNLSATRSD